MGAFRSPCPLPRRLGGEINRDQVLAPGPNHSPVDRSLSVKIADTPDGFIVHSFAGDHWQTCRDYVGEKLGLSKWRPNGGGRHRFTADEIGKVVMAAVMAQTAPAKKVLARYGVRPKAAGITN